MTVTNTTADNSILVKIRDIKGSTRRVRNARGPDQVMGKFWFDIDIAAVSRDIYLPISIASGKKPTGFVYQIEGTALGSILTTEISYKGEGVTQVTLGTLVYCRIPIGKTAAFHIRVEMKGKIGKEYRVVIRQINYKFDPSDARYQKLEKNIPGKMQKFD